MFRSYGDISDPKEVAKANDPSLWRTVVPPTEIEHYLLMRNQKHFGQAHGTPPTVPPVSTLLNWQCDTPSVELILRGGFNSSELDDIARLFLETRSKVSSNEPAVPYLTMSELKRKVGRWPERTSTSPSGRHLGHFNNNIRRYGGTSQSAFAHQLSTAGVGAGPSDLYGGLGRLDPKATLVKRPKDLFVLWDKWMYGIDGRKPAKSFTTAERNNTRDGLKQKYYRRAYIWQVQARLIDGGHSIISANAKISTITGAKNITGVINKLVDFNKIYGDRGHPELCNGN